VSPRAGIPVAVGTADTATTLLATGLTDPAQVQLTVGTGGQIVRPVARPTPGSAPRTHLYRAASPDRWYAMATVQNAGLALDWVGRTLRASWPELYGAARSGPPGALGSPSSPTSAGSGPRCSGPTPAGLDRPWPGRRPHRPAAGRCGGGGVRAPPRPGGVARPPARPAPAGRRGTLDPRFRALLADMLRTDLRPIEVRSASAVGAALLAAEAASLPRPAVPLGTGEPVGPSARSDAYDEAFDRYLRLAGTTGQPTVSPDSA
jgi:xylulokinase